MTTRRRPALSFSVPPYVDRTHLSAAVAIAPWPFGLTHSLYGVVATLATAFFALLALRVATRRTQPDDTMRPEKRLFAYSIVYLFVIFGAFALDRFVG